LKQLSAGVAHFFFFEIYFKLIQFRKKIEKKSDNYMRATLDAPPKRWKLRFVLGSSPNKTSVEFPLPAGVGPDQVEAAVRELFRFAETEPRWQEKVEQLRQNWAAAADPTYWSRLLRIATMAPKSACEIRLIVQPNGEGGVDILHITEEARSYRGAQPALVCSLFVAL
jgi:hypothetical protein